VFGRDGHMMEASHGIENSGPSKSSILANLWHAKGMIQQNLRSTEFVEVPLAHGPRVKELGQATSAPHGAVVRLSVREPMPLNTKCCEPPCGFPSFISNSA
jgi:hypothetical protein